MREIDNEKFWNLVWPLYPDLQAVSLEEMSRCPLVVKTAEVLGDGGQIKPKLYSHLIGRIADRFGLVPEQVDWAILQQTGDNLLVWDRAQQPEMAEDS